MGNVGQNLASGNLTQHLHRIYFNGACRSGVWIRGYNLLTTMCVTFNARCRSSNRIYAVDLLKTRMQQADGALQTRYALNKLIELVPTSPQIRIPNHEEHRLNRWRSGSMARHERQSPAKRSGDSDVYV